MKRTKPAKMILVLLFLGLSTVAFHVQTIKATDGTVYIRADGSIDPSAAPISTHDNVTYTLTAPLSGSIMIERDNIVFDGAGYTLQGGGSGYGVGLSGRNNVTIKNANIEHFANGIQLSSSIACTVTGNSVTNDTFFGIWLDYSSGCTVSRDNVTNNSDGIVLDSSSDNNVSGNILTDNGAGIMIDYSSGNMLRHNVMVGNMGNFAVYGADVSNFINDVDASNTVDGKPICYWVNVQDASVPSDAGCVILMNCTGITVQNLNLTNNRQGALLAYTKNTTITRNNVAGNHENIWLQSSPYNTVSGNNITNSLLGIALVSSSDCTVSGNNATYNSDTGILLEIFSDNSTVSGNNITKNGDGISLDHCSWDSVSGNNIANNTGDGILLDFSFQNTFSGNSVTSNAGGIMLEDSSNNTFRDNAMVNNTGNDNMTANNVGNFGVSSGNPSNFINDVDASNTVDGKPICYWVNVQDASVPSDAGCVILMNCTGITVQNLNLTGNEAGLLLVSTTNTTITQNNVTDNRAGILLQYSSGNAIFGNKAVNNGADGITVDEYSDNNTVSGNCATNSDIGISVGGAGCSGNSVRGNSVTNNGVGINIGSSSGNSAYGNNVTDNGYGIRFDYSSGNIFTHNNFVNNSVQASTWFSPGAAAWDDGYPMGGNYWSDYNGTDSFNGIGQNETGSDGIGDQPYQIDASNTDRYPLMAPYSTFDAGVWNGTECNVAFTSNSTITGFQVNVAQATISFNATDSESPVGFCRVTVSNIILHDLWHDNYTVLLNGEPSSFASWNDTTNTYIYLNYIQSEQKITIVPELPSPLILMLSATSTLVAVFAKRKARAKSRT